MISLTVPAGALPDSRQVVVSIADKPPGMASVPDYSRAYQFQPAGLTFAQPVTVRIPFSGNPARAVVYWSRLGQPDVFDEVPATFDGPFAIVSVTHFSWAFIASQCFVGLACPCQSNADCAAHEDGDLCNGTLYCDKSSANGTCRVLPSSVVTCDDSLDTPCAKTTCNPKTGTCAMGPYAEGSWCDDGEVCTVGERCQAGTCAGGTDKCECKVDGDCAPKEDGNLCNGVLYCDTAQSPYLCLVNPATTVVCSPDADTACRTNTCDPGTGTCALANRPAGTACDDGNMCTAGDACDGAGQCQGGAVTCDCQSDADCAAKEDGDLCNGTLYCDKAAGKCVLNPATIVTCPSVNDTACSANLCQPTTGACKVVPVNQGKACDDGDMCTGGETCTNGACGGGTPTCECTGDDDCASKGAANRCAGTYYCDRAMGKCVLNPATAVTCQTVNDTACAATRCTAATGTCDSYSINEARECESSDPGAMGGTCMSGTCVGKQNTGMIYACDVDADCDQYKAGNKCLQMTCSQTDKRCQFAGKVVCDSSKDSDCAYAACDVSTGVCGMVVRFDGASCNGNTGVCTSGACL